jgi:hypothetical protein
MRDKLNAGTILTADQQTLNDLKVLDPKRPVDGTLVKPHGLRPLNQG